MPVIRVGRFRQWAPTEREVLEVLRPQKNPCSVRQIRELLWDYEKQHIDRLGEVLYINYPTLRKVLDSLVELEEIKKVRNRHGWPKYEIA